MPAATASPPTRHGAAVPAPQPMPGGLLYVSDAMPGLSRVRRGAHFRFRRSDGQWITDRDEVARIRRLAIPPAYTDVWICPLPNGHLQATGRDARGRKQYRYHPDWRLQKDETKFDRMEAFGRALPRIRARVARDLRGAQRGPASRTAVLATLVRLLDTTFVRVGNEAYLRENGSYGLTTLRAPHARLRGSVLQLRFKGKSGVTQQVMLDDPRVARVVRRCQHLPGQELFQYEDEEGQGHAVDSADVNAYLQEAAGDSFTAKDFRTWHGTVQALEWTRRALQGQAQAAPATAPGGYSIKALLAEVSGLLGNTPAVCRKAYIHPRVMALGTELHAAGDGGAGFWDQGPQARTVRGLGAAECRLLAFLSRPGPAAQPLEGALRASRRSVRRAVKAR